MIPDGNKMKRQNKKKQRNGMYDGMKFLFVKRHLKKAPMKWFSIGKPVKNRCGKT